MMSTGTNNCGLAANDRMQIPIRTIALGVLFACSATPVHAESKAPASAPPTPPATTPLPAPLNLALPANATPQRGTLESGLRPPVGPLSGPLVPALQQMAAKPSGPTDPLQSASEEVRRVARWVAQSGDNAGMPYLLIDKVNAQVFAFDRAGRFQAATPALLGLARGDHLLAPNSATMEQMPPQVRITPAGRFVSKLAIDSLGKELLVLDYDASISLHAVVKGTPEERRAERLKSATAQDNRISFGCINVPEPFYATVVSPSFARTKGIVYVLPETSPAAALFGFQPAGTALAGSHHGSPVLDAQPALSAQPAPKVPAALDAR
jgi:hypothetical protein